MDTANNSSLIVEQLITYADWFFPGEIDFDRDLDIGNMNGSEVTPPVGMRRCVSNSSLSDHGESPTQGSPKPATRRKNKPAPTPPSGNTPDKQQTQQQHQIQLQQQQQYHHHDKRPDDKPPPAPDKPPRPLATSTLNRATYKAQKHEVTAELIQPQAHDSSVNNKSPQSDKLVSNSNKSIENDVKPMGFEIVNKADLLKVLVFFRFTIVDGNSCFQRFAITDNFLSSINKLENTSCILY